MKEIQNKTEESFDAKIKTSQRKIEKSFDSKIRIIQNKTENLRNSFDQSIHNVNRTLQMLINERSCMRDPVNETFFAKRFKLEEFFIGKYFSSYRKLHTYSCKFRVIESLLCHCLLSKGVCYT